MVKLFENLLMGLLSIVLIGFIALFGGTLVYWLWPIAVPAALPGLVENGVLSSELMWWPAVCLAWLCGILIKSTQTNNNKSN